MVHLGKAAGSGSGSGSSSGRKQIQGGQRR